MHFLGLNGLPRRVCVYDISFYGLNSLSTIGALASIISGFFMMFLLWESIASGHVIIKIWGDNTTPMGVRVTPLGHHFIHLDRPVTFGGFKLL